MGDGREIDPRAVVDPSARLGDGVRVGPFCVVGPGVTVGERTRLESHTVVAAADIGAGNVIGPFASIGGDPQDLKFEGEDTRLVVGDSNRIREYVTLNRGTAGGGGVTRVGDGNLFMAYSHVGHDCAVGNRAIFANAATLAGHVEVGDGATIGAYSGVHQFCRVARNAFIGGYSVVTQDAMPWVMTVGNRAKAYGLNVVGLRRSSLPRETVAALKKCYQTLFRSKLPLEEALDTVERDLGDDPEVRYFIEFIRSSKRGVVR